MLEPYIEVAGDMTAEPPSGWTFEQCRQLAVASALTRRSYGEILAKGCMGSAKKKRGSAKLLRALEDLTLARDGIDRVIAELQAAVGPGPVVPDIDEDDEDDDE